MLNYSKDKMCVSVYEYLEFCCRVEKQYVRESVGCVVVCDWEKLR